MPEATLQPGFEAVSRWFEITQAQIDAFAEVTQDKQALHLDPDYATQTPFGGTIAHGFLTLSMLSAMAYDAMPDTVGDELSVNYGFDRIRFLSPVRSGASLRGKFVLDSRDWVDETTVALLWSVTIDIDGQDKPALVAAWRNRLYFEGKD